MADKEIQFKFNLSDGTKIQTAPITIPGGQPAPTVTSVEFEDYVEPESEEENG